MGKRLNKLGEFNYIYKSFKVFCVSNPFVACPNKISLFSDDRISCTCYGVTLMGWGGGGGVVSTRGA